MKKLMRGSKRPPQLSSTSDLTNSPPKTAIPKRAVFLLVFSALVVISFLFQNASSLKSWLPKNHELFSFSSSYNTNNTSAIDITLPAFVYIMELSGFGSQMMNTFAAAVYYEEYEQRSMVVDEVSYMYRLNDSVGVLTGYFTPQFPVIDTVQQQEERIQPLLLLETENRSTAVNYTQWRQARHPTQWRPKEEWNHSPLKNHSGPPPLLVKGLFAVREKVFEHYQVDSQEFYQKMVHKMCPHLQFNHYARQQIEAYQQQQGNMTLSEWTKGGSSVAFHVRRGDKVAREESKRYKGDLYVKKLLEVLVASNNEDGNHHHLQGAVLEDCFVASDNHKAVLELQASLKRHNVTCRFWTLTLPSENGFVYGQNFRNRTQLDLVQFFAELDVLIRATYFVGTFNSNVGALVAVLRACHRNDDTPHYAHSYGVDSDSWYLR